MNKLQKFKKENNQLILEVESKLDLLIKGQEINSNKKKSNPIIDRIG